jgi:transcriptional regulator with XRE-family HTH domain
MNKQENKQFGLSFGQFAKQLRLEKNLSQHQIAEVMGVAGRAYVCNLERGNRAWQLWHIAKLAKALNLTMSELIEQFEQA